MNSAESHADVGSAVLAALTRLVVADVALFQAFDRTTQRILMYTQPADCFTEEEVAYYMAHSGEMPLVDYYERTADTKARRISDVIDDRAWRSSDYYLDLPCTTADSLRTGVTDQDKRFDRGRDFVQPRGLRLHTARL